jgi:Flp pilus assembly protein TadG
MSEVELKLFKSERGASLIMVAITLFLLIGSAALAVDIGATWADRSVDQKITDSAATSGALEAVTGGTPRDACEVALNYVAANAREISSIDTSGCSSFDTSCVAGNVQDLSVSEGRYDITVIHPVNDTHELMTSGIVGATPQDLHPDDGKPCGRLAVEITATRKSLFAQLLGFAEGSTTVHSVATASRGDDQPPINLLVLNRHNCETVSVGGSGGIIVEAIIDVDPDTGVESLVEGTIAADSDGTVGCNNRGVLHVASTGARMWAHGPTGCSTQFGTHPVGSFTAGDGCGKIQVFAGGTPGCEPYPANFPACTPGGSSNKPKPDPTRLSKPFTRGPVDHRYNCYSNYAWSSFSGVDWATEGLTSANWQDIKPCTSGDPAHIYNLIRDVKQTGAPSSSLGAWNTWPASNCNVSAAIAVSGNWYIPCTNFRVQANVTINGGNVVFGGDVTLGSGGHLKIDNASTKQGWAFFRGGELKNTANGSLTLNYTMVYMAKGSSVGLTGSNGTIKWIAPDGGPFDDLALWSDSGAGGQAHTWAGQAGLEMEGVFFMPRATAEYRGGSAQQNTKAQWIADKLSALGNSALVVAPADGRSVSFEGTGVVLIR